MTLPLTVQVGQWEHEGTVVRILDSEGSVIVEYDGPDDHWRDLERIVESVNNMSPGTPAVEYALRQRDDARDGLNLLLEAVKVAVARFDRLPNSGLKGGVPMLDVRDVRHLFVALQGTAASISR